MSFLSASNALFINSSEMVTAFAPWRRRLWLGDGENSQWQGTYNAVSPEPVSNKTLIMTIAKEKNKLFVPVHVPDFLLKVFLGEMSTEILKSATVSSWKAEGEGFDFHFPTIEEAVRNLEKH